jgi:tetratricopeptide (TPR) repeat protein
VYRFALSLFLSLSLSFVVISAPNQEPAKRALTADDLKKAVSDLGSPRFAVREQAKRLLADAGAAAEPLLEEAAKNPDEEISSSAKAILEKFQWGLYPDTPKEVRDLVDSFRSGPPEQRQQAIANLLKRNPVPFPTIRRLIGKEVDEELRGKMLGSMYRRVHRLVPGLVARGELAAAEAMLEEMLPGSPSYLVRDYAAFMSLRDKLGAAIARFEKERMQKGDATRWAAEVLVYLYRSKGDWAAARRAAIDSKNDDLVAYVSWQANDWKALASESPPMDRGNVLGAVAAYSRLAGNTKEFDAKIAEINKFAGDPLDAQALEDYAIALLLNGKPNDAVKILTGQKKGMAFTFDLLCAQMKFKEAFDLVDEARRRDTDPHERIDIEIRRARMLYLLGEKDAALQFFGKIAGQIEAVDQVLEQVRLALSLVNAETRVGLHELACHHAAKFIDLFANGDISRAFLESIFGEDQDVAHAWLTLFRRELPNEAPAVAIKRISDILAGKLDKKTLDEWIGRILKKTPPGIVLDGVVSSLIDRRDDPLSVVAAAYRSIADDAKTEEFLKKAAEKSSIPYRWIELGDFQMERKKHKEAAEAYSKAAKPPVPGQTAFGYEPALPTYLQGRALLSAGDAAEGKRLIELAHWLPLGNDVVRARLVEELNKRNWPVMARREADFLLKTGDYDSVLRFLLQQSAKEKDYFKAAEYFEKGLVNSLRTGARFAEPAAYLLAPESVRVLRARGYLGKGEIDKAEREAFASLEVVPGNVELAIKLIPELNKLGKKKQADAIFGKMSEPWEKLCKDYPNSAFAHNSLAWLIAVCGQDLDVALKHAQKAVEFEPENAQHLDTLAEVHFRKGDRDQALSLMKKCIELDPKRSYYGKQLVRFKDQPCDSLTPDVSD